MTKKSSKQFRKEIGLTGLADEKVLVVDFGSTFTKVGIFDTKEETFELRYKPTTPRIFA